jgi:hypothetical protein
MDVAARSFTRLQSLYKMAQHAGQLRRRISGPQQLLTLLLAGESLRQDIVRAGDDLQRLAQIQRRREIAVSLVGVAAQRGANALIIEEILKAMAPSGVRPAEIRKALQDNGVAISFPSIHHALRQLEARNAAEQVGDSNSWRYHEA